MRNRKYVVILFTFALSILLTGCTRFGKIADDETVLSKVEHEVTNEKYTYVSEESKFQIPKKSVYTFQSEERDLEFVAVSTLTLKKSPVVPISTYGQTITVKYVDAVHDLYLDRIKEVLNESKYYSSCKKETKLVFTDTNQFGETAELLAQANEIYHEETEYNDENWLCDNPVMTIYVYMKIDKQEYYGGSIKINGCSDKTRNLVQLNDCYLESTTKKAREDAEAEIEDVLSKSKCYDKKNNTFTFRNEKQLDAAAELLEQANSIVSKSPVNVYMEVRFYMVIEGEVIEYNRITNVDGIKSKAEYRQEIDNAYEHCQKTKADYENTRKKF